MDIDWPIALPVSPGSLSPHQARTTPTDSSSLCRAPCTQHTMGNLKLERYKCIIYLIGEKLAPALHALLPCAFTLS